MYYLDLVSYFGEERDNGLDYSIQVDPDDQRIYIVGQNSARIVAGKSKPVIPNLLNLNSSELANYLYNEAVINGRVLYEYLNSVFGIRFINPNSISERGSVITNLGGIGYIPGLKTNEVARTMCPKDITYNADNTVNTDSRTILDGPPEDIRQYSDIDDNYMSEIWEFCNNLEDDLKTIEAPNVRVRKANIKDKLANAIYTKNSVVTDLTFITHMSLKMNNTSVYVDYVVMDSESIVHSPNKEVMIQHAYDAVDNANGKLTVVGNADKISISNFGLKKNRPIQIPVIICQVFDIYENDYKFLTDVYKQHMYVCVGGEKKYLLVCD